MAGELINDTLIPMMGVSDIGHFGQTSASEIGKVIGPLVGFGGAMAYMAIRSKISHAPGSHEKPAEIREARVRSVKPWESGLLLKNGSFYDSIPILDDAGNPVEVDGEQQFTKEFHKVITQGLQGYWNLIKPLNKLVLVNNLPDEATFQMTHIQDKDKRTYNLTGGMTWAHVRAQDEHKRPMVYEYREPSPDGKRPAGPIKAAEALLNAINTAPTRAEAARQLTLLVLPEVVKRLQGEANPQQTATEHAFYEEIEDKVHDRFLERGSVLLQLGVAANVNPETVGSSSIADAMKERTTMLAKANRDTGESGQFSEDELEEDEIAAAASRNDGTIPNLHLVAPTTPSA